MSVIRFKIPLWNKVPFAVLHFVSNASEISQSNLFVGVCVGRTRGVGCVSVSSCFVMIFSCCMLPA